MNVYSDSVFKIDDIMKGRNVALKALKDNYGIPFSSCRLYEGF